MVVQGRLCELRISQGLHGELVDCSHPSPAASEYHYGDDRALLILSRSANDYTAGEKHDLFYNQFGCARVRR